MRSVGDADNVPLSVPMASHAKRNSSDRVVLRFDRSSTLTGGARHFLRPARPLGTQEIKRLISALRAKDAQGLTELDTVSYHADKKPEQYPGASNTHCTAALDHETSTLPRTNVRRVNERLHAGSCVLVGDRSPKWKELRALCAWRRALGG